MKMPIPLCLTAGLLGWAAAASADVLELKNGKILTGQYAGGTTTTIRFETSGGIQVIETSQALALTFSSAAAPATAPASAAATGTGAPSAVSIPAGTTLLVRMVDGVSSRDPKGKRFTATLETDLVAGGVVVAKAGTKVYGRVESAQKAGRFAGQSSLDLRLAELAMGSALVPIVTGPYSQAGARSGGKTARGAAAGAAIGAIADGGDGAGTGAAIGAVASGLKKGQSVDVTPGTLLEFQLQQAVNLNIAR